MRSSAIAGLVHVAKKKAIVVIAVFFTLCAPVSSVTAMEFSTVRLNDGTLAVRGSGEIVWGDHQRLDQIASGATVGEAGERILLLNSAGGDIDAAIMTAEVIDKHHFMTVVAWGDTCLSACGSVLFLSGNARLVLGDGRVSLHDCQIKGASREEILFCRKNLALFAGTQGYPPNLLWTGMSFGQSYGIEWANIRSSNDINCKGFQRPIGLSSKAQSSFPPCMQLMKKKIVSSGRDWDDPPKNPQPEPMVPGTPIALYFETWTPPDGWSYDFHEDAVSVGFRRRGQFPAGPELEILCGIEKPAEWIVIVKSDVPERFTNILRLSVTSGGLKVEEQGRWSLFEYNDLASGSQNYAFAVFAFDRNDFEEIALRARRDGKDLAFELMASSGVRIMRLATPAHGLLARLINVEDHCIGRYPRR